MFTTETIVRVRYAETDRMGYVYYGNYATYFEVGRVETLRALGITYKSLEDEGVMLPVLELRTKYFAPAFYDDELTIKTSIIKMPSIRIQFEYETWRGDQQLNSAFTELVFVNRETGKPMRCPDDVLERLKEFFS